jgi:hypothetical protein
MENKKIFVCNKKLDARFWSRYVISHAWSDLAKNQLKDEIRYTNALLGFNKLSVLFGESTKDDDWGRRTKDLVYGYWTEEDVRLKLAAELCQYANCQVHGQVHIKGTKNKQRNYKQKKHEVSTFPDILLLSIKEKDVSKISREKNLESAALELKYFGPGWNKQDLKEAITADLNKLKDYQRKKFIPRIDCGIFLCMDESGKAEEVLKELFKKKKYNNKPLGYGIIVPSFANLNMDYPRHLENYSSYWDRQVVYTLDCIKSNLDGNYKVRSVREDDWGFYIYINKNESYVGWIYITQSKRVPGCKAGNIPVMVYTEPKHRRGLKGFPLYKWSYRDEKFVRADNSRMYALVYSINESIIYSNVSSLEDQGTKIAKIIKKIFR